ncbi:hypothetical protein JTE90_000644 [Oedothorax gibbosus]|uniref:BTB domain-containing protein n=1 Tax=Oedothorax gibbosus TaxID=931172 RepID=A0AAV6VVM5_9ARAC|nr:hypothetical protein JTE90_000644 [Oedothorax gibbosus]
MLSQLSENYGNLMDNDDLKDFVLKCAGEEIRVHKCILAARSPVFATMFKSDMAEAQVNSVDIVDVEPGILRKLLKFTYSGQIDDFTNKEAGDLLYAANKYQLDILKEECIQNLKQNLSDKNVFDAIKFGDMFDQGLKDRAIDFVVKHGSFAQLRETEGWKSLHAANPTLAMEITTAIVDHMQKRGNALTRQTLSLTRGYF